MPYRLPQVPGEVTRSDHIRFLGRFSEPGLMLGDEIIFYPYEKRVAELPPAMKVLRATGVLNPDGTR